MKSNSDQKRDHQFEIECYVMPLTLKPELRDMALKNEDYNQ